MKCADAAIDTTKTQVGDRAQKKEAVYDDALHVMSSELNNQIANCDKDQRKMGSRLARLVSFVDSFSIRWHTRFEFLSVHRFACYPRRRAESEQK